jgi:hypothetical protein
MSSEYVLKEAGRAETGSDPLLNFTSNFPGSQSNTPFARKKKKKTVNRKLLSKLQRAGIAIHNHVKV